MSEAAALLARLEAAGLTMAVAESLTGGMVMSTLVSVPGASRVVRGGVVAYANDIKASLLGVDEERLALTGPVDAQVAVQMAAGVARLLGADVGLSTTGVAGPGPADGVAAGTVYVGATLWEGAKTSELHHFEGNRGEIRAKSVDSALALVRTVLGSWEHSRQRPR